MYPTLIIRRHSKWVLQAGSLPLLKSRSYLVYNGVLKITIKLRSSNTQTRNYYKVKGMR